MRRFAVLAFALTLSPIRLLAQATSTPNQIGGRIEFSNSNPAILDVLSPSGSDEGFRGGYIEARSIPPTFKHTTTPIVDTTTRTKATYELTVESSLAGIPYEVSVQMNLYRDQDKRYVFAKQVSAPATPEPAPDVKLDFIECAALADVRWLDSNRQPIRVDGGRMNAYRGSDIQARDFSIEPGLSQQYLAVRGDGSEYRIVVDYVIETGSDPYKNLIRYEVTCEARRVMTCDAIEVIECIVPPEIGEPLPQSLGRIVGRVDMSGESENRVSDLTRVVTDNGPFNNYRLDTVLAAPSEGPFELENLLAGTYRAYAELSFRRGRRSEYFFTPWLAGTNPRVPVGPGETTDLGATFVLDPGFVRGPIVLAGPPPGALGSCLEDLRRDADNLDANNVPRNYQLYGGSAVQARGVSELATNATLTADQGRANVGFEGDFDPARADFSGDYDLVLGGLRQERSRWKVNMLYLSLQDFATPSVPASFQSSHQLITNRRFGIQEIVPGVVLEVPHRYCMSQVNLKFTASSGVFFNPVVRDSAGSFRGRDFRGDDADYAVRVNAAGTPLSQSEAAALGLVVMCLPQGSYALDPYVTSVNPGTGGTSQTQLPRVEFSVGCRQVVDLSADCRLEIDELPSCSANPLRVTGRVASPTPIQRIYHTVNGGPEIDCAGCSSPFAMDVVLAAGDNTVSVNAVTVSGRTCSVTGQVRFEEGGGPVRAALVPLAPRSARSANSGASSAFCAGARTFRIDCDAAPGVTANLVVFHDDVVGPSSCATRSEEIPVVCGEEVTIAIDPSPCAGGPRPPSPEVGVVRGQRVELHVTGRDTCGTLQTVIARPEMCAPLVM